MEDLIGRILENSGGGTQEQTKRLSTRFPHAAHIIFEFCADSINISSNNSRLPRSLSSRSGLWHYKRFQKAASHSANPPHTTPPGNRGHSDETTRSLARQVRRLEACAIESIFDCPEHCSAHLDRQDAGISEGDEQGRRWRTRGGGFEVVGNLIAYNKRFPQL